jgi:hypothetical protein
MRFIFDDEEQLRIILQYDKWGCTKAKYSDLSDFTDNTLLTLRMQKMAREIFAHIYATCLSKFKYSSKYTPSNL